MWADFQVYIKDASFREEHFCDWNFRSISSHSWVVLILVRKPLDCFWLWSMVLLAYLSDDSLMWADFQVYIKDASFREEHFCHWNFRSISLIPELYWFSWESLWSVFDYDPWSFLLIYLTPRWCEQIFSIKRELSSSRGTFLSLKLSHILLSFLSCIDSREKAFGVFLIMIHGPSSLFIWRLVDVSWFSSLYKRCVFSRGTFLWLKLSLYLISFLSCIDSREKAFGLFLIMIHGPSSLFIWRLVDVSWFSSLYKRWVFSRGTFLWLKLSLYLISFLSCIDSREKAFGVFLIMIHGPSSLFIWRLVDVSWFSSLYKRCVFSRGTFLSLKLSLYLPHSWVVLILVRKPLECFWLWSMVLLAYLSDDSLMWADFQVYIKDASFREEHFCDWNFRSISSHSWVVLILVRKPLECFWLWSMVLLAYLSDDSLMWPDFQVYIKDASFREEHFCDWNFRSISSHSWVVLILVRKPLDCFWIWSMVLLAYLSQRVVRQIS